MGLIVILPINFKSSYFVNWFSGACFCSLPFVGCICFKTYKSTKKKTTATQLCIIEN